MEQYKKLKIGYTGLIGVTILLLVLIFWKLSYATDLPDNIDKKFLGYKTVFLSLISFVISLAGISIINFIEREKRHTSFLKNERKENYFWCFFILNAAFICWLFRTFLTTIHSENDDTPVLIMLICSAINNSFFIYSLGQISISEQYHKTINQVLTIIKKPKNIFYCLFIFVSCNLFIYSLFDRLSVFYFSEMCFSTGTILMMTIVLNSIFEKRQLHPLKWLLRILLIIMVVYETYLGLFKSAFNIDGLGYPLFIIKYFNLVQSIENELGLSYYIGISLLFLSWIFSYKFELQTRIIENEKKDLESFQQLFNQVFLPSIVSKLSAQDLMSNIEKIIDSSKEIDKEGSKFFIAMLESGYKKDNQRFNKSMVLKRYIQIDYPGPKTEITPSYSLIPIPESLKFKDLEDENKMFSTLCLTEGLNIKYYNGDQLNKNNDFNISRQELIEKYKLKYYENYQQRNANEIDNSYPYNLFIPIISSGKPKPIGIISLQQRFITHNAIEFIERLSNNIKWYAEKESLTEVKKLLYNISSLPHMSTLHFKETSNFPEQFILIREFINKQIINITNNNGSTDDYFSDWYIAKQEKKGIYVDYCPLNSFIKGLHVNEAKITPGGLLFFFGIGVLHSRKQETYNYIVNHWRKICDSPICDTMLRGNGNDPDDSEAPIEIEKLSAIYELIYDLGVFLRKDSNKDMIKFINNSFIIEYPLEFNNDRKKDEIIQFVKNLEKSAIVKNGNFKQLIYKLKEDLSNSLKVEFNEDTNIIQLIIQTEIL